MPGGRRDRFHHHVRAIRFLAGDLDRHVIAAKQMKRAILIGGKVFLGMVVSHRILWGAVVCGANQANGGASPAVRSIIAPTTFPQEQS